MKLGRWRLAFGLSLALASTCVYIVMVFLFHKPDQTTYYFFQDLAFVPISVLLVTLVLDAFLRSRERREKMTKLNMVVGVFYSEAGNQLIRSISRMDSNIDALRKSLLVTDKWDNHEFKHAKAHLQSHLPEITARPSELEDLHAFLSEKRDFLLRLLENPNLLEHESFTNLLRAVFHIAEELECRNNLEGLCETDINHLSNDIKRAYVLLILEWLDYIHYLKSNYPYLFSLSTRMNPFNPDANAEILK